MSEERNFRVGFGYDCHRLVSDRPLWLGGIHIEHNKGLLGHSDADALLHAIADALLGAAALGDIGHHFPDTSEETLGMDSKEILRQVVALLHENGYSVGNIDATICAESPKMAPHIDAMRSTIAQVVGIPPSSISIKATTNERMGFIGREEGIACFAVALTYLPATKVP